MPTARKFRARLEELVLCAITRRDAEWTRAIVGEAHVTMTPQQGAKWLEVARRRQVAQVIDATRFKGRPKHY